MGTSEMEKPCWGGPVLTKELLPARLQRILDSQLNRRSFTERFAKARELFRLGLCLYLEQEWESCMKALIEAFLLEEKAIPQALSQVQLSGGPDTCPFGRLLMTLCEQKPAKAAVRWSLPLAFLEVHWLDMQMIFARELCARHQDDPEVASEHQRRWFELLCSLDDLARKTLATHGGDDVSDRRILSRLTLVQAQYGANPPLSRPALDCERLAARAVALWPQDPVARLWCARREDLEVLEDLLEPDAPQREKLRKSLNTGAASPSPKIEELLEEDSDGFKISGSDYVVLEGDHTEKDYSDVAASG